MHVALLHQLPLEYYPPTMNLLRFIRDRANTLLLTSRNEKNREEFSLDGTTIHRDRYGTGKDRQPFRFAHSLLWHWRSAYRLKKFKPDVIIYFEPHSALAAHIYYRFFRGKARLFAHHYEYYAPEDYVRPGNRIVRLGHQAEKKSLFGKAIWISQTNEDRLRLFKNDLGTASDTRFQVLPNFPPRSWQQFPKSTWTEIRNQPLRLVYVGSVSLHDTYIGPLVEWIRSLPPYTVSLDLFAYNLDAKTKAYLQTSDCPAIRYHETGVAYDDLPRVLSDYHVGLILYRGNTTNFVYNTSNKLFEYLTCGLDAWYPPVMQGIRPYATSDSAPRVLEVDFDQLREIDLNTVSNRAKIPETPLKECAEEHFERLWQSMCKSL